MEISLRKCVHYIARFWWILVIATVLGGLVGFVVSTFDSGMYRANGTIKIEFSDEVDQNSTGYSTFRTTSIANVIEDIKNRTFLSQQFDAAGATALYDTTTLGSNGSDVLNYISVAQSGNSDFITISCRTESGEWSVGILEKILEALPSRIQNGDYTCTIESAARLSEEITPTWRTSMLTGLVIGLISGVVVLILARAFDTRILEESDISDNFELEILGDLSEVRK